MFIEFPKITLLGFCAEIFIVINNTRMHLFDFQKIWIYFHKTTVRHNEKKGHSIRQICALL